MKSVPRWLGSTVRRGALAWLNAAALSVCTLITISTAPAFAQESPMKIRLHVNGEIATATLHDSATARDFAALLPVVVNLDGLCQGRAYR
jgi:hypothetical protein